MLLYIQYVLLFIAYILFQYVDSAVPIDIEIYTGKAEAAAKEPKFFTMVPDKKPLISRRQSGEVENFREDDMKVEVETTTSKQ